MWSNQNQTMGWKGLPRIEKALFQRPKHEENHAQTMVTPFNPQFSGRVKHSAKNILETNNNQ